jgi:hypothetical protein
MNKPSPDTTGHRGHRREKATIDHLAERVFEPESREKQQHPSTTGSGAPVEEQVRKEWDPKKGGLPVF